MPDLSAFEAGLRTRSGGNCELCGAESGAPFAVPHSPEVSAECSAWVCARCVARIGEETLENKDWFCLKESAWSEHLAVQVLSVRLLRRLGIAWASDLAEQIYFDEAALAWVDAADSAAAQTGPKTFDSNGTELHDGDSVTLIKDLDVRGGGFTAKRGTMVKGIRLTGDPENIEGRVNKMSLVLKTEFLKKA